ncbi:MAG: FecR domain-containing protein [Opitutus sp.]
MTLSLSSDSQADETAALWAARLEGAELSAVDRTSLSTWLAAHPSHRRLLSTYCQFSADLEQPLLALVESGAIVIPAAQQPRHRVSKWKLFAGSALLASAGAIAVAVWVAQPRTEFNHIATPLAQRQSVTLSDGTRVDLNAHTSLQVALSQSERRVKLISGEAFFAVQKDPARPFVIETPGGSVWVTGTTFDVRSADTSSLEVTVVEGSVQVRPGDSRTRSSPPILLGAGDKLSSSPKGVSVKSLSAAAVDNTIAWRKGEIVFKGVPLRDALARYARYHGRSIVTTDAAGDLQLGGRYSLDDFNGFLVSVEEALPIRTVVDLDGTVRVTLREEK